MVPGAMVPDGALSYIGGVGDIRVSRMHAEA